MKNQMKISSKNISRLLAIPAQDIFILLTILLAFIIVLNYDYMFILAGTLGLIFYAAACFVLLVSTVYLCLYFFIIKTNKNTIR